MRRTDWALFDSGLRPLIQGRISMAKILAASGDHRRDRALAEAEITGVSLVVRARETLASTACTARLIDAAGDALARHGRLGARVEDLDGNSGARRLLAGVCGLLAIAAAEAGRDPAAVEIAVDATDLSPREAWLGRQEGLGGGPLYLLAEPSLPAPGGFWQQLWQLREQGMVRAAFAPVVSSGCPLLAAEAALAIQPSLGVQVPAGSAWVSARIHLPDFADDCGEVHTDALECALGAALEAADAMHDAARWATAQARHDAWFNRRVAIALTGIGDLVERRGQDPRSLACLEQLDELCAWSKSILLARSRALSDAGGTLPALRDSDPQRWLPASSVHDSWRACWQRAVARHAVRNRNLLVMSPWSVLPRSGKGLAGYLDLLPLLAHADAFAFAGSAAWPGFNFNNFMNLHQRARAAFERSSARGTFAEQA